ncbi:MAG: hypothetical protein QOI61_2157, partial [Actinomycetota bacterium]
VSMVVGRAAQETVWPALLEWLEAHDAKRPGRVRRPKS